MMIHLLKFVIVVNNARKNVNILYTKLIMFTVIAKINYLLQKSQESNKNIYFKRGEKNMGNIIKINMYVDMKRKKNTKLDLKTIEEVILEYKNWLKKNSGEDKIETYEKFLRV